MGFIMYLKVYFLYNSHATFSKRIEYLFDPIYFIGNRVMK